MIHKMQNKVLWSGLGAALLGVTLAGCGNNAADNTATTSTTTAPATSAQNTTAATGNDDHAHAPGEAPHAHEGEVATSNAATGDDNHDAEIEATMAKFFPGATLAKKPFPLTADAAQHFSEDTGVKFSGEEIKWQAYEATRDGQRVGLGMMTHSPLPDGKDMHIAFAVNPKFAVTQAMALDAPNNAQMQTFLKQAVGKTASAPFKVGQGLKAPAGLSPQVAQIAADAVKKGLAILDSNFNANSTHSH